MSEQAGVLHADDSNFHDVVLKSELPCLVDFWAPWCGPCKMLGPLVDAASERWQGQVQFVKVDVDSSPNTATKYGVRGIPTLILFQAGETKHTKVGLAKPEEIDALIQAALQDTLDN